MESFQLQDALKDMPQILNSRLSMLCLVHKQHKRQDHLFIHCAFMFLDYPPTNLGRTLFFLMILSLLFSMAALIITLTKTTKSSFGCPLLELFSIAFGRKGTTKSLGENFFYLVGAHCFVSFFPVHIAQPFW